MITCRELIQVLDDYQAGTLADDARAIFERHLSLCPPCCDYLKTYRDTIALATRTCRDLDEAAPPDVPEALVNAILALRKKP